MKDKNTGISPAALGALLKGDLKNAIAASTPGGIEAQEAQGQKDFCASTVLPKEFLRCTKEQFEAIGIVFGEDHDRLFINCTLPEGWKKVPTDHSMWSKLVDDKGRTRARMFYKAAFYDQRAHIEIATRYNYTYMPADLYKDASLSYEERNNGEWFGAVLDSNDNVVFKTEPFVEKNQSALWDKQTLYSYKARDWLVENYPDWEDPLKYWDED